LEAHDTVVRAVVTGDFDAIPKEHHKALKKARGMNEKLQTLNRDQEERRSDRTTIYGAKQKVVGTTGRDETRGLGEISLVRQDQEGRYRVNPNATYSKELFETEAFCSVALKLISEYGEIIFSAATGSPERIVGADADVPTT
jgi:hypothetical protein